MKIERLQIPDVCVITPRVFGDARGAFCETFNQAAWREAGLDLVFVQDNHAVSRQKGVVRGLHYQTAPYAQGKLVRVVRGAIYDVAVDLRKGSASFGQHVGVTLTAESWQHVWVPPGFAHGYCTLHEETDVIYKVTQPYAPECERGVQWDDPALNIAWPVDEAAAILSDKDKHHPAFQDVPDACLFE